MLISEALFKIYNFVHFVLSLKLKQKGCEQSIYVLKARICFSECICAIERSVYIMYLKITSYVLQYIMCVWLLLSD